MPDQTDSEQTLLRRICASEERSLGENFGTHHERLRQMVQLRLDRRSQGRIDSSGVLQETFVDACVG